MGGTGDVHFAVSSKNPLVQKFVEQGIGQLHGFWFGEAERSFRQAAQLDPNCGIAYWGMAQAAQLNSARAAQFAAEAARHKTGLSDRERMYIDALTNESGYRALMGKYPEDLEAKAFEILATDSKGGLERCFRQRLGIRHGIGARDSAGQSQASDSSCGDPHC